MIFKNLLHRFREYIQFFDRLKKVIFIFLQKRKTDLKSHKYDYKY